ncbi:MAG: DoxX family protein [Saprospiraceae bacterium]
MNISKKLDQLHYEVRSNKLMGYFSIFTRIVLALGFLPSGFVKIMGERFTDLHSLHPLGQYFDALAHTGYYYPFIGVMQMLAAILLLIPITATLGVVIYLPIILNITILTFSTRFDGSSFTAPLMLLANLYLIAWDYHKFKWILPLEHQNAKSMLPSKEELTSKFPFKFFAAVAVTFVLVVFTTSHMYELYPRNTIAHCKKQCEEKENKDACLEFCECIHTSGGTVSDCVDAYEGLKERRREGLKERRIEGGKDE